MSSVSYARPDFDDRQCISGLISFINGDTNVEDFAQLYQKCKKHNLAGANLLGETVLFRAAMVGNINLINYIIEKGGQNLLFLCMGNGKIPLHATASCADPVKAELAARRLIQLGTPADIKTLQNPGVKGVEGNLLTTALRLGSHKIVALCLRLGMIPSPKDLKEERVLEDAKNEIMTDSEKLLKLSGLNSSLPSEVIDYILRISAKLV